MKTTKVTNYIFLTFIMFFSTPSLAKETEKPIYLKSSTALYAMPNQEEYLYSLEKGATCDVIEDQGKSLLVACLDTNKYKQVGFITKNMPKIQALAKK